MGNGMNKVLPGLYVGNYRDSKDPQQLEKFQITHIVAIHDSPRRLLPDKHYLCVMAADTPDQNLSQYFSVCNDFIHAARLREGNVLIHCLAGMSRSVTVAIAYIMTVTNLNWKEALKVVRSGRTVANPNVGFQAQLQEFEMYRLSEERRRLRERFPSIALEQGDRTKCVAALDNYEEMLQNKDICEGNCSRGTKCPTGVCNLDPTKGLFRRRPSSSTSARTHLRAQSSTSASTTTLSAGSGSGATASSAAANVAQSCPTSPNHSALIRSALGEQKIPEDEELSSQGNKTQTSTEMATTSSKYIASSRQQQKSPTRSQKSGRVSSAGSRLQASPRDGRGDERHDNDASTTSDSNGRLQRSASTVSGLAVRPRSSPAGLHKYTGSVPWSVHGSRVDLRDADKGSAIYLGCTAPRNSSLSLSSRGSSGSSAPPTPTHTPPSSPRHSVRRAVSLVKKQS